MSLEEILLSRTIVTGVFFMVAMIYVSFFIKEPKENEGIDSVTLDRVNRLEK